MSTQIPGNQEVARVSGSMDESPVKSTAHGSSSSNEMHVTIVPSTASQLPGNQEMITSSIISSNHSDAVHQGASPAKRRKSIAELACIMTELRNGSKMSICLRFCTEYFRAMAPDYTVTNASTSHVSQSFRNFSQAFVNSNDDANSQSLLDSQEKH